MKRAVVFGVSGQDGAYLAHLLLEKDYTVFGVSRDAEASSFVNLNRLGIRDQVRVLSAAVTDFRSVLTVIAKTEPDEIYNLSGQSSVGLSFQQPAETLESISVGTLNLLEAIRFVNPAIRFYSAGSTECFGDTGTLPANEDTPFRPRSPYAVAKAAAFWQVANYREAYGMFVCSGILSNHESPLRPTRFVTRKLVSTACRIASGSHETLTLGNLHIVRDWGWAPDYVDAMWRILQYDFPADFVVSTGSSYSLEEFVSKVFAQLGLDWREYVRIDAELFRPTDIRCSRADPSKARVLLSWQAQVGFAELIERLVAFDRSKETGTGLA